MNDENVPDYDEYLDLGTILSAVPAAPSSCASYVRATRCRARIHHHYYNSSLEGGAPRPCIMDCG